MHVTVRSLHIYPIKACAGIDLCASVVDGAGLAWDRRWLVIDAQGHFLSQRTVPQMACIRPTLTDTSLVVTAPGLPNLAIGLNEGRATVITEVGVWGARIAAHVLDSKIAAWFTQALNVPCQLVRAAEPLRRQPNDSAFHIWLGLNGPPGTPADHAFGFADGFPLLIANQGSLDQLNQRLATRGQAAVGMNRFRPNIVIDGLEAFDEDHVSELIFGALRLGIIKACRRCSVPNVDPVTGRTGHEPGATLAGFRQFDSGILFGQNAIVAAGGGETLRVGSIGEFEYAF
jgi:uncharacterized protein YcbX